MRTFIAFAVPAAAGRLIHEQTESLREKTPGVKWVPPNQIHITLFFLGEINAGQAERLLSLMADRELKRSPIRFAYQGLGTFPRKGPPRVVILEAAAGAGECTAFHDLLGPRIRVVARTEERAFTPHVTLGRVKTPGTRIDLASFTVEPGFFEISRCVLYESILRREGPEYRELTAVEFDRG